MEPEDKIRNWIGNSDAGTDPETDRRILADSLEHLEKLKTQDSSANRRTNWRELMQSRITKVAAAAVILISVVVLTSVFVETSENVALASVLEKVEQTQAYRFKINMTFRETTSAQRPLKQKIEGTIVVSDEYGTKSEMQEQWEVDADVPNPSLGRTKTKIRYILPKQKLDVLIKPDQKTYIRQGLNDDSLTKLKNPENGPREMLKRMMECEYTKLGSTTLNGKEVEGFETRDPKWTTGMTAEYEEVIVKLWVDVETQLPVLWETNTKINEQMSLQTVISDYQWDIPVAAGDFEPVIPEDYRPQKNIVSIENKQ